MLRRACSILRRRGQGSAIPYALRMAACAFPRSPTARISGRRRAKIMKHVRSPDSDALHLREILRSPPHRPSRAGFSKTSDAVANVLPCQRAECTRSSAPERPSRRILVGLQFQDILRRVISPAFRHARRRGVRKITRATLVLSCCPIQSTVPAFRNWVPVILHRDMARHAGQLRFQDRVVLQVL